MVSQDSEWTGSRRRYVTTLGALGAAGLAGCSSSGGGGGGGNDTDGGNESNGSGGSSGAPLELLHGWLGGDGAAAVQALEQDFKNKHPDMPVKFKGIGGGANVSLNATITRRLANNNPMSSFANWPGKNLARYEGALWDVEEQVWNAAGLKDKIHDATVEACTVNGKMPAVPLGSHRMNNLFFNTKLFEEAGVDASSLDSVDALISALEKVNQNTDAAPMAQAMKAPWTNLQLFAQILTSQSGVEAYTNFIEGNPDRAAIVDALESLKTILTNYINDDSSSISFTTANSKVISGEAACIHQGNWAYGMYRSDDSFNYKEDWDWVPFPGTEGMYFFHLDSFVVPKNNPTPEKSITWMKYVGSKDAQIAYNNPKGSVPLRTDVDPNELTDFLKMNYNHLLSAEQLPPTIAHGLAVTPETLGACKSAFGNNFMGPFNVEKTADALVDAVSS
ncbi:ABC transporter substrate-binding protein [Halarchaeum sp. P4]|uniref:ABC transporter substrate-binding protein n=1 Tax=Halarchaeum sp. P4 TaxID=3421639 RepID=UPI003EBAE105